MVGTNRAKLGVTNLRWIHPSQMVHDQVLVKDAKWYLAQSGLKYGKNTSLFTGGQVLDRKKIDKLHEVTKDEGLILVGDSTGEEGILVQGWKKENQRSADEIARHMLERHRLLERRYGKLEDVVSGEYPSLLDDRLSYYASSGHDPRRKLYQGTEKVRLILAIDGTDSTLFKENGRSFEHAIRTAEEFLFQQKHFYGDELSVVAFGTEVKEIPISDDKLCLGLKVDGPRKTAQCLRHCMRIAQSSRVPCHVYLLATGNAEDLILDVAKDLFKSRIGFTYIFVGDGYSNHQGRLTQVMWTAGEAKGDVFVLKKDFAYLASQVALQNYQHHRE